MGWQVPALVVAAALIMMGDGPSPLQLGSFITSQDNYQEQMIYMPQVEYYS